MCQLDWAQLDTVCAISALLTWSGQGVLTAASKDEAVMA